MSKLTRSKVAYDLNISPHKLDMEYDGEIVTFVFSSNLYKEKFLAKLEMNRSEVSEALSKRYGCTVINNTLADLKLYKTIEKRGFLLYKEQVKVECLSNITLDGNRMIIKS